MANNILPSPRTAAEANSIVRSHDDLIAAGKMPATTADPDKDLLAFAAEFGQLARSLKFVSESLEQAYEAAEGLHEAIARRNGIDRADRAYQNDINAARRAASRRAQQAMAQLARLVGELQCEAK